MDATVRSAPALADPETGEVVSESTDLGNRLHQKRHPKRREGVFVEGLAALVVAHVHANVVKLRLHRPSSCFSNAAGQTRLAVGGRFGLDRRSTFHRRFPQDYLVEPTGPG